MWNRLPEEVRDAQYLEVLGRAARMFYLSGLLMEYKLQVFWGSVNFLVLSFDSFNNYFLSHEETQDIIFVINKTAPYSY